MAPEGMLVHAAAVVVVVVVVVEVVLLVVIVTLSKRTNGVANTGEREAAILLTVTLNQPLEGGTGRA